MGALLPVSHGVSQVCLPVAPVRLIMPDFHVLDEIRVTVLKQILRQKVGCAFRPGMSGSSDGNQALNFMRILCCHVAAYIGTAAITNDMRLVDSQLIQEHGHIVCNHSTVPGQIITQGSSVTAEIRK